MKKAIAIAHEQAVMLADAGLEYEKVKKSINCVQT
jgi:hypothetical protein